MEPTSLRLDLVMINSMEKKFSQNVDKAWVKFGFS